MRRDKLSIKVFILEAKYSGKPASEKLTEIGNKLQGLEATSYIVTNLEEIACIFDRFCFS